jgi:primary-amine oxidase
MRVSNHLDSNHFAYPLDICAEMSADRKVVSIMRLPSGESDRAQTIESTTTKKFDRRKLHSSSEYYPELIDGSKRTTEPYIVQQSNGPSFRTQGNLLTWEKWRLRVGFNYVSHACHSGSKI